MHCCEIFATPQDSFIAPYIWAKRSQKRSHNFQRLLLCSMLCIDFLKFLENQGKEFYLRPIFFNLVKVGMSPVGIFLLKLTNGNRRSCEISSKLTIKTPEWCQWHLSCDILVNFKQIWHRVLVFLFLTLSI